MTRPAFALLFLALAVTACGPIPVADAERQCLARAYDATGPHGEVLVGVADGKARSRVSLDISTDYLAGRDPSAVFDQCVLQKSGQMPRRPLTSRPDWTG